MKAAVLAMAAGTLLTVEQRDVYRTDLDPRSASVSADGRFVAFATFAPLAAADGNRTSDVYVLDREDQRVTLESMDTGGHSGEASSPGISGDGRFVVFERAGLVMVRDRSKGITTIVGTGRQPLIADGGRLVFFVSGGSDRVPDPDLNGGNSDVYGMDLVHGQTWRVSVGLHGLDARTATNDRPSASADGSLIAFVSRPVLPGGRGGEPRIFVRDSVRQVTTPVGPGWDPSLSGDGRFVAFVRLSEGLPHIFVADLHAGTTRIITNSVRRRLANGSSAKPAMSFTGRFVAFQSEANDLVTGEDFNLLWDVFVWDRATDAVARLSGDRQEVWLEPSSGPSIDAAGSVVAFSSRHPTGAGDTGNDYDLYVATVSF
jgi:Tol biopolymer transport system component